MLNWELEKEFEDGKIDEILKFFYELAKDYPFQTEQTCLELATEMGKELSLNLIAFFQLVGILFEIELNDSLSSILTDMASQFFLYFPFLDNTQIRNFLLLQKVYLSTWLSPHGYYSPECVRGLLRVFQHLGIQSYRQDFNIESLFVDPSNSSLYTLLTNYFCQSTHNFPRSQLSPLY